MRGETRREVCSVQDLVAAQELSLRLLVACEARELGSCIAILLSSAGGAPDMLTFGLMSQDPAI